MGKMFDIDKLTKAINKKQATINRQSKKLKNAPKSIFVGWDSKSGTYPEQGKKPVSYIAKIHEEGLGNHTEKHMIKSTVFLHSGEWSKLYSKLVKRSSGVRKRPNYYTIAEKVGLKMKEDLRDYLYEIDLIDTTRLANSIIIRYRRR